MTSQPPWRKPHRGVRRSSTWSGLRWAADWQLRELDPPLRRRSAVVPDKSAVSLRTAVQNFALPRTAGIGGFVPVRREPGRAAEIALPRSNAAITPTAPRAIAAEATRASPPAVRDRLGPPDRAVLQHSVLLSRLVTARFPACWQCRVRCCRYPR